MTALSVPELSLVVLVGITGSGKSTFARAHFRPTEVISSDFCRGLVADDENDQSATPAAFELLEHIVSLRLTAGRLTVIDATNVQPDARRRLVALAREHDVLPVAIVLDLPERLCADRNASREDRDFGPHVIRRQRAQLRRHLKDLPREGFRTVHTLRSPEEADAAEVTRTKLYNDLRHETGPFDVIGDVHGCRAELEQLLLQLGYAIDRDQAGRRSAPATPAAARCSSATWWTGARTRPASSAWSWAWSRKAPRSAYRATTRPSCSAPCAAATCSAPTASPSRWTSWPPSRMPSVPR